MRIKSRFEERNFIAGGGMIRRERFPAVGLAAGVVSGLGFDNVAPSRSRLRMNVPEPRACARRLEAAAINMYFPWTPDPDQLSMWRR